MRRHDRSLTAEQMAMADLLDVRIVRDNSGFFPVKINATNDCLRHKVDKYFRWWPDAETAIKVAANPAKYEMYWP